MSVTLEQTGTKAVTRRSVFILRFISTVVLWSIALLIAFSGFEILFWLLISAFGMLGLLGILPDARSQRSAEFQSHGMICGAVMLGGSFYYFSKMGPAGSYDFEVAVLLFFLLTVFARQMFASLRHDEPLQTMAYTLFGLLYVLWLFNFTTKIVYLTPPLSNGVLTGQFYVLYLIAVTKFADMGAYLTGSAIGRHHMVPHISAKENLGRFLRRARFCPVLQLGAVQADAGPFVRAYLDACDHAWIASWIRSGHR